MSWSQYKGTAPRDARKVQVVGMFLSGKPTDDISNEMQMSVDEVTEIIQGTGKVEVARPTAQKTPEADTIWHDYFDTLVTEEQAYWLGYIMCYATIGNNTIRFRARQESLEGAMRFMATIGLPGPAVVMASVGNKKYPQLDIASSHMTRTVLEYATMDSREFLTRRMPDGFWRHWLRGFIESGCISFNDRMGKVSHIDVTMTNTCQAHFEFAMKELLKSSLYIEKSGLVTARASLRIRETISAMSMYDGATIFVPTVKDSIQSMSERRPRLYKNEMARYKKEDGVWIDVATAARIVKMSEQSILNRIHDGTLLSKTEMGQYIIFRESLPKLGGKASHKKGARPKAPVTEKAPEVKTATVATASVSVSEPEPAQEVVKKSRSSILIGLLLGTLAGLFLSRLGRK